MSNRSVNDYQDILDFWFGPDVNDADAMKARNDVWYKASDAFDQEIKQLYESSVIAAEAGELDGWTTDPHGKLAIIVLTDQFPRNIYRGTARAFEFSQTAESHCLALIESGQDKELAIIERSFAYLPLEHSENINLQNRSVELFTALHHDASERFKVITENALKYAVDHHRIVEKFGRFPHRNKTLNRESTLAEIGYMTAGGENFGQ